MTTKIEFRWRASPEFRFFLIDPEGDGTMFYRTAADRDERAKAVIQNYLDEGSWAEEVTGVCCGEVTHIAQQIDREDRPADPEQADDEGWPPECDYRCNYAALPIPSCGHGVCHQPEGKS